MKINNPSKINLNLCKQGDVLVCEDGDKAIYDIKIGNNYHQIQYPHLNYRRGYRRDDGIYDNNEYNNWLNIVKLIRK